MSYMATKKPPKNGQPLQPKAYSKSAHSKTSKKGSSKRSKTSVAKLKKEADKYWSQYIRLRDSDRNGIATCITCGARKPWKEMQNGHFISRRVNLLRYDEQNCNAQDYSCNVMRYGEQYKYAKELDLKYGTGTADKLHAQRFTTHKFTIPELQAIIEEAKDYIKNAPNH